MKTTNVFIVIVTLISLCYSVMAETLVINQPIPIELYGGEIGQIDLIIEWNGDDTIAFLSHNSSCIGVGLNCTYESLFILSSPSTIVPITIYTDTYLEPMTYSLVFTVVTPIASETNCIEFTIFFVILMFIIVTIFIVAFLMQKKKDKKLKEKKNE